MPPKQQTRYTRPVPPSPYDSQPSVVDENTIRAVSPSRHGDHPPSFHSHHDEQDYSYPSQPHQGEHESYDSYRDVNLANDGYDEEGDDALDYRVGTPGYRVTDETWEEAQEEVEAGDESVEYVRAGEAEDAPAPYRPRSGFGARDYEEVEKVGDESFDGPVEWSEKDEERKVLDPEQVLLDSPVTFAGGFGAPPPTAQQRRNKTNRVVKLIAGNLVLQSSVPTRLTGFLPRQMEEEFKFTRYTAVTCGPEEFNKQSYQLRPAMYDRKTELFVVVTLYNENEVLFCRTLHGIMLNIAHLCGRNKSKTWGVDSWKKVVVCIVADGRKAVHPRIFDCLSALGVYQEGMAKNRIDDKDVQAHVYEYTTQLSVDPSLKFRGLEKGIVPVRLAS